MCCNDNVLCVDHERSVYKLHHGNVLRLSDNDLSRGNVLSDRMSDCMSDNDVLSRQDNVLSSSRNLLPSSVLLLLGTLQVLMVFSS